MPISFSFPRLNLKTSLRPGLCVVQRPSCGAQRDLLVPVCGGHGHRPGGATARYLGLIPALPDPQRLPQNRRLEVGGIEVEVEV